MTALSFASPEWLWLLLVPAVLVGGYVLAQRRRARYALTLTTVDLLRSVMPRRPQWRRHLPPALLLLGLVALALGLANPVHQVPGPSIVVLAVDVSPSMRATDVTPTRFEAMKRVGGTFLDQLPGGVPVGLVSFAGTARIEAVPTVDHQQVAGRLAQLTLRSNTSLADAVRASLDAVRTANRPGLPAGVVLISDGGSGAEPLLGQALDTAVENNVSVSTIALGTPAGRITLASGPMAVPVEATDLHTIAQTTHGLSFDAASTSRRIQAAEASDAMSSANISEGFFQSWILRGRSLISQATIAK